jgi:hypothetical protein
VVGIFFSLVFRQLIYLFVICTGATFGNSVYSPCTTSYDYDAPLSEAGDPNVSNKKFNAIKNVVNKYLPDPGIPIPPPTPKYAYGKIQMTKVRSEKNL